MRADVPTAATVSACLITKNESSHLPDCLSSLAGQVDEVVVVDTGSTDGTVAIARHAGCRVFTLPWRQDFSEPRNLGLEMARSDWILYVDADERLSCSGAGSLGSRLMDPTATAARVKFHPKRDMTAYAEYRLFRRDPRIRFSGAMHETMLPGIVEVCAQDGTRIVDHFEVALFHLGYEGDQSAKHARNLPLLEKAIADDPLRVYLRYHLGMTLFALGRTDEAEAPLVKGMENAGLARVSGGARAEGSMCAQVLSAIRLERGETDGALEAVETGLALYADNLALRWMKARCLVALELRRAAIDALEPLLAMDAETVFDPRMAYEKSLFGADTLGLLGSAWFGLGAFETAQSCFERAAACAAEPREFLVKAQLAKAKLAKSQPAKAHSFGQ